MQYNVHIWKKYAFSKSFHKIMDYTSHFAICSQFCFGSISPPFLGCQHTLSKCMSSFCHSQCYQQAQKNSVHIAAMQVSRKQPYTTFYFCDNEFAGKKECP